MQKFSPSLLLVSLYMLVTIAVDPVFYRRAAKLLFRRLPTAAMPQTPPDLPAATDITFPIDLVYTWVDGTDADYLAQRTHWARSLSLIRGNQDARRFEDHGELQLSLRSVQAYLPWIRTIFIITNDQTPPWLDTSHPKIRIISASHLFASKSDYPSFNSHALEFQLHHIPDLAEHFIYCCDDMFFGQPCQPGDFFDVAQGKSQCRLSFDNYNLPAFLFYRPGGIQERYWRQAWNNLKYVMAKDFPGYNVRLHTRHQATPLKKSLLAELAQRYPYIYQTVSANRFRALNDVPPIGFAAHYALATGQAIQKDISSLCANITVLLRHMQQEGPPKLLCINSCDSQDPAWAAMAKAGFYTQPSEYEKTAAETNR